MLTENIRDIEARIRSLKASIQAINETLRLTPDPQTSDAYAVQRHELQRDLDNAQNELNVALVEQRRRQGKERNPDAYRD